MIDRRTHIWSKESIVSECMGASIKSFRMTALPWRRYLLVNPRETAVRDHAVGTRVRVPSWFGVTGRIDA